MTIPKLSNLDIESRSDSLCACAAFPNGSWCSRYQKPMSGRLRQICEGTSGLSPQMNEAYRRTWAGLSTGDLFGCIHFGEKLRELECGTCSSSVNQAAKLGTPVHACGLFMECIPGIRSIESHQACGDCASRQPKEPASLKEKETDVEA